MLLRIFRPWLMTISIFFWPKTALAVDGHCQLKRQSGYWTLYNPLPLESSETMNKVRDGLALTIEYQILLSFKASKDPVALSQRCRIIYDLWAEKYVVSRNKSTKSEIFAAGRERDALQRCMAVDFTSESDFQKLDTIVILNPVDENQQERTREWLATKGLGGNGSGMVGRAIGAVMNLKADKRWTYDCVP